MENTKIYLTDEEILDILDGTADTKVQEKHTFLINAADADYQKRYAIFAQMNQNLAEYDWLEAPSMRFSSKVVEAWEKEQADKKATQRINARLPFYLSGIAATLFLVVSIFVIFYGTPMAGSQKYWNTFFEILDKNKATFINIVIIANLLLILQIVDKRFIRPRFVK